MGNTTIEQLNEPLDGCFPHSCHFRHARSMVGCTLIPDSAVEEFYSTARLPPSLPTHLVQIVRLLLVSLSAHPPCPPMVLGPPPCPPTWSTYDDHLGLPLLGQDCGLLLLAILLRLRLHGIA